MLTYHGVLWIIKSSAVVLACQDYSVFQSKAHALMVPLRQPMRWPSNDVNFFWANNLAAHGIEKLDSKCFMQ
jgi:hypothetical protein